MTLTTIGYGDIVPRTDLGKIFTSFYALFGIGVMLYILISVIGVFIFKQERFFNKLFFRNGSDDQNIQIREQENEIKKAEKKIKKQEKVIKKTQNKLKVQDREIEDIKKDINEVDKKKKK